MESSVALKNVCLYSPPDNTKLNFDGLQLINKTVLCPDFNAHSILWNYSDVSSGGKVKEELLNSDVYELIYRDSDTPIFLHYNGTCINPDLTLSTANITEHADREVIFDLGSCHRIIVTYTCSWGKYLFS
ncbi:hypothetical protein TNCT_673971 [Trichonephila clavata]|uniref:Endonuclease/exonuclease/phosphatase domain-containing protein n=1 Tax=Trichonephila clavata TaxID=2740835 RepID=A0A8X6KYY4_TRICU|nr:hypothetical protein TNCT_673971 [Trichonephila clavata]